MALLTVTRSLGVFPVCIASNPPMLLQWEQLTAGALQMCDKKTLSRFLPLSGVFLLVATILLAGCGSSNDASTGLSSTSVAVNAGISRPSAGTVEAIDALGDTVKPDGTAAAAPREADIDRVSISKEGDNLVFTMNVAGPLPATRPPDTGAAEWGFLLDTNGDGKPDWGIYGNFPGKDNWSWGLYNENTQQRTAGQQFPGTFTVQGTTITWKINPASFGNPQSFKWMAYTDDTDREAAPNMKHAGDRLPDKAWPTGNDWLDYP